MSNLNRVLFVMLLAGGSASTVFAQSAAGSSRTASLINPAVSVLSGSRVAVTMWASGESLKELITLTLDRDDSTGAVSGECALVVRYAEYLDEQGNVIEDGHSAVTTSPIPTTRNGCGSSTAGHCPGR